MMDAAIVSAKNDYNAARTYLDGRGLSSMPITIGETGWNAVDDLGQLAFRAHPVNQKMYLDRLADWAALGKTGAGPKAIFYFEAFDEPWKQRDNGWGLFNVAREARYAIQSLNPASATWVFEAHSYTDASAVYFIPPVVGAPVTESKYSAYSEAALTASELRAAAGTLKWDAWDGTTATYPEIGTDAAPGDGSHSIAITPKPAVWGGWGLFLHLTTGTPPNQTDTPINLANFAATGTLNFSVKSFYPGKIEVGFLTDTADRVTQEAYLAIGMGDYGYCNTGAWCHVSIPIKDFLAANKNLDPSLVLHRFVIADRFANTLKAQGTTGLPTIEVDGIYWAR
jgi:hypothetical protein